MSEALRSRRTDHLTPYEAVLRSFGYRQRRTAEEHAIARAALERAVQHAPGYADAWALLSYIHCEEYATGFNAKADPLGRALHAAQCAAEAAPSNCLAQQRAGESAILPQGVSGLPFGSGTGDRPQSDGRRDDGPHGRVYGVRRRVGTRLRHGERAMQLNPRHPGWYWFPLFYSAYRKRDYPAALTVALKIDLPHFFYQPRRTRRGSWAAGQPRGGGRSRA